MNSNFTKDFNKPTKFTAENYGTKISVEIDHSDLDIDEVMDAFQTLIIGMGYHQDSFKKWVLDRADEYNETDAEDLKEKLEAWKFDEESSDIVLRHNFPTINTEEEDDFFGPWNEEDYKGQFDDWKNETPDDRYLATEEDEDEFDDYGMRIIKDRPHFEWGDEPEDDEEIEPLFDGDEFEVNENLKSANERYKKEVKKMNAKQKRQSKK